MSVNELKQKLSDYYTGKLDKQIHMLKEHLKYPPTIEDDLLVKVQTSRSISSPVEDEVLNLMGNKQLDNLIRRKACIEKFIRDQTPEDRELLRCIYQRKYSRVKISVELYLSRKTIYNREYNLLLDLAKYLAWEV